MDLTRDKGTTRMGWPTLPASPPLSCDRPEYAPFLVAHWAYAVAIDPRLIVIRPTTNGMENTRRPDGGFMVVLDALPLERLRVP